MNSVVINRSIDDGDHVIVLMVIMICLVSIVCCDWGIRFLFSMLILHSFQVCFLVAVVHIVYEL